jgi:hypothetical protein
MDVNGEVLLLARRVLLVTALFLLAWAGATYAQPGSEIVDRVKKRSPRRRVESDLSSASRDSAAGSDP